MQQGQEVGALARTLYPNGLLVSGWDNHASAAETRALMADLARETIFEATALAAPFVAKADILTRIAGGWHLLEVKSSFSDTKDLAGLVDDLAYTMMVFRRFGVPIAKASLLLLSREYRHGDHAESLFQQLDMTAEALPRAAELNASANSISRVLFHHEPPDPKLGPACCECAEFGTECLGARLEHTVLEIPGLHYKKLQQLAAAGIVDVAALPPDLKLNDRQQRAVKSVLSGQICIEDGLEAALGAIEWPCYYLDFETVATVLPLYSGHGCHQQVLTQFSIHQRDRIGSGLHHAEYLADATRDCQRELAEELIKALGQHGSVLVYSAFEQTRIKALQSRFPDLSAPLQAILDRLVDLHPIIADHVYHPDFHGSFSIKKVLPALVPDLSYDDLEIRNGDAAITRFARMARGEIVGPEVETTWRQLLRYCERDTLAMVRLHERLIELASGQVVLERASS
jgi:predicted RecB family nuclease